MRVREGLFAEAVERFHEAAGAASLWPDALQLVANAAGAAGANLIAVGLGVGAVICSPSIRDFVDGHVAEGWLATNPYMRRGMELTKAGRRGLITSEEMLGPAETARDPYINEYRRPNGIGPEAGMVLVSGPGVFVPLTIDRRSVNDPFDAREISALNRLVARFQPAAQLAMNVRFEASQTIADSFSRLGDDIALIGGTGRLIHLSVGFERHFEDALVVRNGRVGSWRPATDAMLSAAIDRAVQEAAAIDRAVEAILLPRRSGVLPLKAQIVPIAGAAQDIFALARAALIVSDPFDRKTRITTQLGAVFGLSPAEARLAGKIGDGEDLTAIAQAESISLETARKRLKAVFAKTGTHRQAELASVVARLMV
ncbi:MAG: hypothetical protein KDJ88_21195 [Bauldia sp.]|nr:hypothetical protein [Bauldia sp.]